MAEMVIRNEDDIVAVRTAARNLASLLEFSIVDKTRIATAVSELARNTLVHGGGGAMHIERASDSIREGIRCIFIDKGPGIPDIDRAMGSGYSTANSLGQGLPGARRLTDDFRIESTLDEGTKVEITKWKQ